MESQLQLHTVCNCQPGRHINVRVYVNREPFTVYMDAVHWVPGPTHHTMKGTCKHLADKAFGEK